VLVLAGVVVQRAGQHMRRHGVRHDREPAGVGAVDHEPVGPERKLAGDLPVGGAQHPRPHGRFLVDGHRSSPLPVGGRRRR
jgi:hypothetical protein